MNYVHCELRATATSQLRENLNTARWCHSSIALFNAIHSQSRTKETRYWHTTVRPYVYKRNVFSRIPCLVPWRCPLALQHGLEPEPSEHAKTSTTSRQDGVTGWSQDLNRVTPISPSGLLVDPDGHTIMQSARDALTRHRGEERRRTASTKPIIVHNGHLNQMQLNLR
jgi:hypothetical protein